MAYQSGFRRKPFRRFGGPREMHTIKCSKCGKDAEVPFKPVKDRPVYCRDCYFKEKGITPREPMKKSEEEISEDEDIDEESDESEEDIEDEE